MDSRSSSPTPQRYWGLIWAAVSAALRGEVSVHREQQLRDDAARDEVRWYLSVRGTLR